MAHDLLLEIGVEELPASFVSGAVAALPGLLSARLADLRLEHGRIHATGTPRRLAVIAEGVAAAQPDLDEEVLGPPARVAFDASGKPTRAAQSFAEKIGVPVEALARQQTPKGEYVVGRRREKGVAARELLPAALAQVCEQIPFRKSMRWANIEQSFGRPVRWLVALFGAEPLAFEYAGVRSGPSSQGHRFLSRGPVAIASAETYVSALRKEHVLVDMAERKRTMVERLQKAAADVGGALILDEFLVEENSSLVEDPHVVVGSFDREFLKLPERVILDVAKGHQRYFGMRDASGRLLPHYLAVVGTAENPDNIRRGNDRVMRARLADAKFFFDEDSKRPLAARRPDLDAVLFHKRLGSVGDKVRRIERLVGVLGSALRLAASTIAVAEQGAALAKCDLVTLMVGELPELQGEMGQAYALAQGTDPNVARVIAEHYLPRGADDDTAPSEAGALVALADRIDTLVGCFAIGQIPTGAADPLGLRRAAIGVLRTLLDKGWDLSLSEAIAAAHAGYADRKLDLDAAETQKKLGGFLSQRLRGLLSEALPADVVDACIAASADRPHDVALRARALSQIEPSARQLVGEVFKRAANIAKDARAEAPVPPAELDQDVHPSEQRLFEAFQQLKQQLAASQADQRYSDSLQAIADFAPVLGKFFDDVFVMVDDERIRNNRLCLMREIHATCSKLANFNLLAKKPD